MRGDAHLRDQIGMNEPAMKDASRGGGSSLSISQCEEDDEGEHRLYIIGRNSKCAPPVRAKSYVSITIDIDGHIDFESEVNPEHAEKMTDVLLLSLIKAREARG